MYHRPLLAWLDDPATDRGIHFALSGDEWAYWTYARLAELTYAVAHGLVRSGVRPGDTVVLMGRSGPGFVAALFGTLLAGATPSPLAPPVAFQDRDAYGDHLRGVLGTARPALIVVDAELEADIAALAAGEGTVVSVEALAERGSGAGAPPHGRAGELALLQFTSGSSGAARGVRVPYEALEFNVAAMRRWLRWTADDAFASWLPLHHDMGLVGGLICTIVAGSELWLLQPEQFVREPLRYLRCLGERGARLSATPGFGLDLIVRRVPADALAGLDFSGVRGMVIGAERVDARTLDAFLHLLVPAGLRRASLLPAYGLAEATLAVTGVPLEAEWRSVSLDPGSLEMGRAIEPAGAGARTVVVGCGRPLEGVSLTIAHESGAALPEGHVGEVVVRGASLAAGYLGAGDASLTRLSDGELRTGDAGFLLDGQLFVLGRLGDSMKVRGRMLFSDDLEVVLGEVGVPRGRVAVLLGLHAGAPTAVLLAEEEAPTWRAAAETLLRQHTAGARVVFVSIPRGAIARTSSGKPRRRQLWRAFADGLLRGATPARATQDAHPRGTDE